MLGSGHRVSQMNSEQKKHEVIVIHDSFENCENDKFN